MRPSLKVRTRQFGPILYGCLFCRYLVMSVCVIFEIISRFPGVSVALPDIGLESGEVVLVCICDSITVPGRPVKAHAPVSHFMDLRAQVRGTWGGGCYLWHCCQLGALMH